MKFNINKVVETDLKEYLRKRGLKLTKQREKIAKHFLVKDKHFSVEELYYEMKKITPSIGYTTVYRTLKLLVSAGLAVIRHFSDNIMRFEPLLRNEHHDHIICIGCGRIVEFENYRIEKLQNEVSNKYHFYTVSHKLELYGYCNKCRRKSILKGKK